MFVCSQNAFLIIKKDFYEYRLLFRGQKIDFYPECEGTLKGCFTTGGF